MLINREGLVFVGRRIDQTVEGWQMPQGGIDEGETPRQAALRELKEEVGTDKAEILARDGRMAHLRSAAASARRRAARPLSRPAAEMACAALHRARTRDIDIKTHEPEFAAWKWLAIEALPRLIVPFKRDTYSKVIAAFRDIAGPVA